MKLSTIFSPLLLVGIFSFSTKEKTNHTPSKPATEVITQAQRDYAVTELKRTKDRLEQELKGLSNEQKKFRAAPDKWSIEEIMEHIALAENGIFNITQTNLKEPANPAKRKEIKITNARIKRRLAFRGVKVKSPESIKPTGKFPTFNVAYKAFSSRRDATISYISTTNDDLLNHFWKHPATGTIDLYQTILLISAHCHRHTLQIKQVKKDADFPKN